MMVDMDTFLTVATAFSGLNVLLLLVLMGIWGRNYRQFRSSLTVGLLGFAVVFLLENLIAIYFFFSWGALYAGADPAQLAVLVMRGLQFLALLLITAVSMR